MREPSAITAAGAREVCEDGYDARAGLLLRHCAYAAQNTLRVT